MDIRRYTTFIFDVEGTICNESELYPGVLDLIAELERRQRDILFLSYDLQTTEDEERRKLERLGISARKHRIVVLNSLVSSLLVERYGTVRVSSVDSPALSHALRERGHTIIHARDQIRPQVIVADGSDQVLSTLDDHTIAMLAAPPRSPGAAIALVRPGPGQATLEPLHDTQRLLFRHLLSRQRIDRVGSVLIGDKLRESVRAAVAMGVTAVWISGGAPYPSAIRPQPKAVLSEVRELGRLLIG